MDKRKVIFIYRLLVIASLGIGIIFNLYNTKSVTIILSYYTSQINIICLITFIILEFANLTKKNYKDSEIYYFIKGQLIMAVLTMMIIYNLSLAPRFDMTPNTLQRSNQYKIIANILLHEISPILIVIDYILFDIKGNFKKYYSLIWMFLPTNYVIYVYIYSFNGGNFYNTGGSRRFAYFFLDYKKIGYDGVAKWLIFISISILILGYVIVMADNILAKKLKKKRCKKKWE